MLEVLVAGANAVLPKCKPHQAEFELIES